LSADQLLENLQGYLLAGADLEPHGSEAPTREGERKRRLLIQALEEWTAHLRLLIFNLLPEDEADELVGYMAAILRGLDS